MIGRYSKTLVILYFFLFTYLIQNFQLLYWYGVLINWRGGGREVSVVFYEKFFVHGVMPLDGNGWWNFEKFAIVPLLQLRYWQNFSDQLRRFWPLRGKRVQRNQLHVANEGLFEILLFYLLIKVTACMF